MPLHELYGMDKGKLDSKEMHTTTSCAVDQSSLPENDFFELVWENGQISMLGQSSRARKIPTCKNLPYLSPKDQAKDVGYVNANANATNISMIRFGEDLDNGLNEIRIPDEEVLPWLNYGMDESLQHDYSSDFLHELSGITMNDFSLLDKRSSCNQVFRDSHRNSSSSSSHQCQTSFPSSVRSKVSNITENNASNVGETTLNPSASSGFSSLRMEKQDPIVSSNSGTIMNFSHFARPAAIVKANLQNIDMANKNEGTTTVATRSYPGEPTKVFSGECPKETAIHTQHVMEPSKVELKPLEPKSLEENAAVSKQFDPTCKDVSKIDLTSNLVLGESGSKEHEAVEKRIEPTVASSSVCSANGAERCSDDPIQSLKRKRRDAEDSEYQSEDVEEEESFGVKKVALARGAISSRRSRSAEVHNLSERKRRDRINEKMRALQELIPNCNKVDKASMLDEAIEYLKTLQLQVQIMSMGAGLYMPTMMVPVGMQHFQAPHMATFSPMAVGMQMGYGMRMPHDVNGGPSIFTMAQAPQMQGTHLPASHISGATDLNGIARSNPHVFGLPSQGLPLPIPRAPLFPFQGEPLMNSSSIGLNACATAGLMETVDPASTSSLKNPMPNVSSQVMQNTNGCNLASQMSNQCGAKNAGFEHSALVNNSGHASEANGIRAANPGKEDNLLNNKSCYD